MPLTGHRASGLALFRKYEINLQILNSSVNCIDKCIEFEGKKLFASFIYADTGIPKRRSLWECLIECNAERDAPWFITGDFNDLLNNTEKVGKPARPEGSFTDMRTFYSEGDLYDLQHHGDCLSWTEQHQTCTGPSYSQTQDLNTLRTKGLTINPLSLSLSRIRRRGEACFATTEG